MICGGWRVIAFIKKQSCPTFHIIYKLLIFFYFYNLIKIKVMKTRKSVRLRDWLTAEKMASMQKP